MHQALSALPDGARAPRWVTPLMYQPRRIDIQLEEDEHSIGVQLHEPATALDLAMAERSRCRWGHYAVVKQHGHRLPLDTLLQEGALYTIEHRRWVKQVIQKLGPNSVKEAFSEELLGLSLSGGKPTIHLHALLSRHVAATAATKFGAKVNQPKNKKKKKK